MRSRNDVPNIQNFNFGVDSVFTHNRGSSSNTPNNAFLLLNNTPFLLLDGTDFLLLGS